MNFRYSLLLCVIPMASQVFAADSFYGTWKMRSDAKAGTTSQTMTLEPAADGVKVTTVIDFGNGTKMSMNYLTKLDDEEVPVYSDGKEVMKIRAKRTGPNSYEGSTSGPGGTGTFKTTVSADGRTMTTEGTMGTSLMQSTFDRVN